MVVHLDLTGLLAVEAIGVARVQKIDQLRGSVDETDLGDMSVKRADLVEFHPDRICAAIEVQCLVLSEDGLRIVIAILIDVLEVQIDDVVVLVDGPILTLIVLTLGYKVTLHRCGKCVTLGGGDLSAHSEANELTPLSAVSAVADGDEFHGWFPLVDEHSMAPLGAEIKG
jgi:hypothetical protein